MSLRLGACLSGLELGFVGMTVTQIGATLEFRASCSEPLLTRPLLLRVVVIGPPWDEGAPPFFPAHRFAGMLLPVVAILLPGIEATIAFLDYNDCYGQRLIAAPFRSRQQYYLDCDLVLHQS